MFELAIGFATLGVVGCIAGGFAIGHAVGFIHGSKEGERRARRGGASCK